MQSMMQVFSDIQVEGRFFPRGSRAQVVDAAIAAVLPDPNAHITLCCDNSSDGDWPAVPLSSARSRK